MTSSSKGIMAKAEILIERLRIRTNHGVFAQETVVGNVFEVSLRLSYPPALEAMADDNLGHSLNYAEVIGIVKTVMATPSQLLEHVVGRIRAAILEAYPAIDGGEITVRKLTPPVSAQLDSVGFTYSW